MKRKKINTANIKFWFNQNSETVYRDCDCACETGLSSINYNENIDFSDFKKAKIQKIQISNNHYAVWNNTNNFGIKVLNKVALNWFEEVNLHSVNLKNIKLLHKLNVIEKNQKVCSTEVNNVFSSWLHLSNNCNLNCSFCYLAKNEDNMSLETGLQSINSIFYSAVKNNIKEVKLKYAGAEALYNFKVVEEMQLLALQLAKLHNIKLTSILLTNSTLLTDKIIEKLKLLQFKVMVSIDGIGKYHDYFRSYKNGKSSYNDVIKNTEKLKKYGILGDISITVSDKNIVGLPKLVKLFLEKDYPFNINFYREYENSVNESLTLSEKKIIKYMKQTFKVIENNLPDRSLLSSLLDRVDLSSPHKYTCGIGRNYAVIDHHGLLSKCQMEIGKNKTFETIASKDLLNDIKTDINQLQNISIDNKIVCQNCEIKYYCTGGCPIISGLNKSPNCNIYKSLFKDVLKLEAKRLLKYCDPIELNMCC